MYTLWWWHEYWRHRDSRSGKIDRSCRSTAQPVPRAGHSSHQQLARPARRRHAGLQRAPAALSHTRDTARSPATIVTVTHAKSSSHLRHLRQTIVAALLLMLPLLPALGSSTERRRAYAAPHGTHCAARTGAPCFSADVAPILALSGSAQPSNALSDMGYYIAEQRSYTKVKSALLRYTLLSLSWAFLSRSCLNVRFFFDGEFWVCLGSTTLLTRVYITAHWAKQAPFLLHFFW